LENTSKQQIREREVVFTNKLVEARRRVSEGKSKRQVFRTTKKEHLSVTEISWLMLFKEIIRLHTENLIKSINTKSRVTDC
jgi:hypothetical protein